MNANSYKLTGKVAAAIGVSNGIGADIAKDLAAEGTAVPVDYSAGKAGRGRAITQIKSEGGLNAFFASPDSSWIKSEPFVIDRGLP